MDINKEQAEALAALVHALRPEWGVAGILAGLRDAAKRVTRDPWILTEAALGAARSADLRTPAMICEPGPWWPRDAPATARAPRCTVPGHASYPAHACGACKADRLAPDDGALEAAVGARQADRPARRRAVTDAGAEAARAALAAARGVRRG